MLRVREANAQGLGNDMQMVISGPDMNLFPSLEGSGRLAVTRKEAFPLCGDLPALIIRVAYVHAHLEDYTQ